MLISALGPAARHPHDAASPGDIDAHDARTLTAWLAHARVDWSADDVAIVTCRRLNPHVTVVRAPRIR